jgi:hypothetical protein
VELALMGRRFGECRNLFFGLTLILRDGHRFANDFSTRLVVFHIRGSLALLGWDVRAPPTAAISLSGFQQRGSP